MLFVALPERHKFLLVSLSESTSQKLGTQGLGKGWATAGRLHGVAGYVTKKQRMCGVVLRLE